MKTQKTRITITLLIATLIGLVETTSLAAGQEPNPNIFPPTSHPFGKSYGEWSEAWWQWALSIPFTNNPWANDPTGEFAAVGQSGPVWFLGSALSGSVERSLSIPSGKVVLVPAYIWIFGSCAGDCDPSNPGVACDVPTLRAAAAAAVNQAQSILVLVDGKPVNNPLGYRALSPDSFSVTLPSDNVPQVLGLPTPAGIYSPQVSDGYWYLIKSLKPGEHTVSVQGFFADPSNNFQVIYHITVEGKEHTNADE